MEDCQGGLSSPLGVVRLSQPRIEGRSDRIAGRRLKGHVRLVRERQTFVSSETRVRSARLLRKSSHEMIASEDDLRSRIDQRTLVNLEEIGIARDDAAQDCVLLLKRLAIAREFVIVAGIALRKRDI